MITIVTLIGYCLWAMVSCPIGGSTKIEKEIPQVEIQNLFLKREIKHYLDQCESPQDTCYWNLIVQKMDLRDMESPVFEATLYREKGFDNPMEGSAYIVYGRNIIVIEGTLFKSLFKKNNHVRRKILMYRTRIPSNSPVPYIKLKFSESRVLNLYFEN